MRPGRRPVCRRRSRISPPSTGIGEVVRCGATSATTSPVRSARSSSVSAIDEPLFRDRQPGQPFSETRSSARSSRTSAGSVIGLLGRWVRPSTRSAAGRVDRGSIASGSVSSPANVAVDVAEERHADASRPARPRRASPAYSWPRLLVGGGVSARHLRDTGRRSRLPRRRRSRVVPAVAMPCAALRRVILGEAREEDRCSGRRPRTSCGTSTWAKSPGSVSGGSTSQSTRSSERAWATTPAPSGAPVGRPRRDQGVDEPVRLVDEQPRVAPRLVAPAGRIEQVVPARVGLEHRVRRVLRPV